MRGPHTNDPVAETMNPMASGDDVPPWLAAKLNRPPVRPIFPAGAKSDTSAHDVPDAMPSAKKATDMMRITIAAFET